MDAVLVGAGLRTAGVLWVSGQVVDVDGVAVCRFGCVCKAR